MHVVPLNRDAQVPKPSPCGILISTIEFLFIWILGNSIASRCESDCESARLVLVAADSEVGDRAGRTSNLRGIESKVILRNSVLFIPRSGEVRIEDRLRYTRMLFDTNYLQLLALYAEYNAISGLILLREKGPNALAAKQPKIFVGY